MIRKEMKGKLRKEQVGWWSLVVVFMGLPRDPKEDGLLEESFYFNHLRWKYMQKFENNSQSTYEQGQSHFQKLQKMCDLSPNIVKMDLSEGNNLH